MSQRPTGAEAEARVQQSRKLNDAMQDYLFQLRPAGRPLFLVTLSDRYKKLAHPVLGEIDPQQVVGIRADNIAVASLWAKHWLGMRGYATILTRAEFEASDAYPGGCPVVMDAPPARYYEHPQGSWIVVWNEIEDYGSVETLDAYTAAGKRKQTSATPLTLEEGHGAWYEIWFHPVTSEKIDRSEVLAVAAQAGVF